MTEAKDVRTINRRIARKWQGVLPDAEIFDGVIKVRKLTPAVLNLELTEEVGSEPSGYSERKGAAVYNAAGDQLERAKVGVFHIDSRSAPQNEIGETLGAMLWRWYPHSYEVRPHLVVSQHGSACATGREPWGEVVIYPLDDTAIELIKWWGEQQEALGDRLAEPTCVNPCCTAKLPHQGGESSSIPHHYAEGSMFFQEARGGPTVRREQCGCEVDIATRELSLCRGHKP